MKKLARIGLLVGALLIGALAGTWLGAWYSGRAYARLAFAKPSVDQAFLAAQEANWAALIRLDDSKTTLAGLENSIRIRLYTIASWDSVAPPDPQIRKARDRFLTSAKVYSLSHPFSGAESAQIDALLSTVPGRSPTSACENGICRLDDLRLAKLRTATNSL